MSTHQIKGYLYHVHYEFHKPGDFRVAFRDSATMGQHDPDWVLVREHSFEVEIPDDFDPRPGKIAALQEAQRKVRAEMHARITELQEQINKLQALECAQ